MTFESKIRKIKSLGFHRISIEPSEYIFHYYDKRLLYGDELIPENKLFNMNDVELHNFIIDQKIKILENKRVKNV